MTELELKSHLICYIDILGYEGKIKELGEKEFLVILDEAFKGAIEFIDSVSASDFSDISLRYRIFSDNIVIYSETNGSSDLSRHLFVITNVVYFLQRSFISIRKISIRGSITKGQLFIND